MKGAVILSVRITGVEPHSPAARVGLRQDDVLLTINGHDIADVLDYDFYAAEKELTLVVKRQEREWEVLLKKGQYTPLGLEFETYLMDKQRRCANNCIFCFIDQLPKGMRESLYFKDDDVRLSFLLGNYVTMTNFSERDISRIIEMKISPINISVHTTDPELRKRMLGNKNAGRCLEIMDRFAAGGIKMNAQIVLCPDWNDGGALESTLHDLVARYPAVESIAVVPVGLTAHREGLTPLRPVDEKCAAETIAIVRKWAAISRASYGEERVYASDEFYLKAGIPLPEAGEYGGFPQLENGVGMLALLKDEFMYALETETETLAGHYTIATGEAAGPLLRELMAAAMQRHPALNVDVQIIKNAFFGGGVTVAGLLTGRDITEQLRGKELGQALLITKDMLRSGEEVFLDDMTVTGLSETLGVPVVPVDNGGDALFRALIKAG